MNNIVQIDTMTELLAELRRAGEEPDEALLDRIKALGEKAVQPLIDMATDQELWTTEDDDTSWAPFHAVRLLGEMRAPAAVEPLRSIFQSEYDALEETTQAALGRIGEPAFEPLRALLFDRSQDMIARSRAANGLKQIAQQHPQLRDAVIHTLLARLDPSESQAPEDETLNGMIVSDLLDLEAHKDEHVEATIRRAFDEERVDRRIVGPESLEPDRGVPLEPPSLRDVNRDGLHLYLKCTACGYERPHDVGTVYHDEATEERQSRGEETRYSPWVLARRITCPKCGVVDQYELTADAYLKLMAELMRQRMLEEMGEPLASDERALVRMRFTADNGREMHPREALDMYREKIAIEPDRADLRVRHANVLIRLGYQDEAEAEYRRALEFDPQNVEAHVNLGYIAQDRGDRDESRRLFERALELAPSSGLPRGERLAFTEAARDALEELANTGSDAGSQPLWRPTMTGWREVHASPTTARPAPQSTRTIAKVGRNDPCPCGSGKKFKKCHGR